MLLLLVPNNKSFCWQESTAHDKDGGQEQCTHLILSLVVKIFTLSLKKEWSTWKIHKCLTFKPGSSQNGRFQEEKGEQELSSQNRSLPFKTAESEHMNDEPCLSNFLYQCDPYNLVKVGTWFENSSKPTFIDLFLTTKNIHFQNTASVCSGLSDFHKLVRSSLFYTQITLSITGKFMLTITRLEWLMTTHLIFDRNIGEKKWKFESNSTYLNYFKKCCIQSCFSTAWTLWKTKKDLYIFYGKTK